MLIGAPGAQLRKGAVHVFYGGENLFARATSDLSLFGQNDLSITGEATGDELGWAIATGDLDNNRGGDIILGARKGAAEVSAWSCPTDYCVAHWVTRSSPKARFDRAAGD